MCGYRGRTMPGATATATVLDIETPHGPARAHLTKVRGAVGAVVLGHGAGGGVGSRDLVATAEVAQAEKFSVALVEQPYRVAGRRSPAPAHQLDAAWIAVVAHLRAKPLKGLPIICGGRSSGARVACRTAAETGAAGVLCLAFPLHPPRPPREDAARTSSTAWPCPCSSSKARATRSGCRRRVRRGP